MFKLKLEQEIYPYKHYLPCGKKILVLAPHPDDEVFGCGGTLHLLKKRGASIMTLFLTNGAKGDFKGRYNNLDYSKLRKAEAETAAKILGIQKLKFWPFSDRSLYKNRIQGISLLKRILFSFRPDLIFSPSPIEIHPDHRATIDILCHAVKDYRNAQIALYETIIPLYPNCLVDISEVMDKKIKAMESYLSQLTQLPYKEIIIGLNRYRSITLTGAKYAEAFYILRPKRLSLNIIKLFEILRSSFLKPWVT